MSMQTVCMLRMFLQQCRGVNGIEPRHLQQVIQDFVQHVEAFAQKHKIPWITAKPGESHVDQAAQYLDVVDRAEGVYCMTVASALPCNNCLNALGCPPPERGSDSG